MSEQIFDDLTDEYDRLEAILTDLTPPQWTMPSAAPGWTIADVVTHLAITEEFVVLSLGRAASGWTERDQPLDAEVDDQVRRAALPGEAAFERWRVARRASVAALRQADPAAAVQWAAAPLRPRTLATTRLAEHWAHALDITEPLGLALPDTTRLRHIAWLGHATLPYALQLAGLASYPVRVELSGPDDTDWTFGPEDAPSRISGAAGAFCRVGAQRLAPEASGLTPSNAAAATALGVLRNYAA